LALIITSNIRKSTPSDQPAIRSFIEKYWGSNRIVTRSRIHHPCQLSGFICTSSDAIIGLATYNIFGDQCEIVTLNSIIERCGVGFALMDAVKEAAVESQCRRLWLITTNDNQDAISFYQKWGLWICAVYPNAVMESRKLKPEIPLFGKNNQPIRDEIEMEMVW
jgi:N-acetylglutamate synthase-like GNAT family acetyltransferase